MAPGRAVARIAIRPLAVALFALPAALPAQELECDPGDFEVRSLEFTGNRAFRDAELARSVVTTSSDVWLRRGTVGLVGRRRCVSIDEIARDRIRLEIYYKRRGYPEATIDTVLRRHSTDRIDVRFAITEGRPMILDSLTIHGLDTFPNRARLLRNLPIGEGDPFDRTQLGAAIDTILARLRNSGHPRAEVLLTSWDANTRTLRATAVLTVLPGTHARIGDIAIAVQPATGTEQQIPTPVVRKLLGLRPGRVYREQNLATAQRNLYQLDAYQHVEVRLASRDSQPDPPGDSLVNLRVNLIEGRMTSLRTSIGWGALDCFRAQATVTNNNFLGGARRLELTGRLSKLGYGYPTRIGSSDDAPLCHAYTERDLYGDTVNYYAGATFRQPTLFGLGPRSVPTLTVFSRMESGYNAYFRSTPIGASATLTRSVFRQPVTLGYSFEYGRTNASPALFCSVFNVCDLGDQAELKQNKPLAVASLQFVRDLSDNPNNPTRGSVMRLEGRHASTLIGSDDDQQFNKVLADVAWYRSLSRNDGIVFAARLRGGAVLGNRLRFSSLLAAAGSQQFIPPEERLYAGGSTTVRGFRQNELGPAVYIADDVEGGVPYDIVDGPGDTVYYHLKDQARAERTVPTGGNTMVVGNLELRLRSPFYPEYLQWTLFGDFGEVWNRAGTAGLRFDRIKVTPGAGLRVFSIFGPIRIDVGYNPSDRPRGAIYYDEELVSGDAALFCLTPGNRVPVVDGKPPATYSCPSSYEPPPRTGFWRRLVVNLSIGQAF